MATHGIKTALSSLLLLGAAACSGGGAGGDVEVDSTAQLTIVGSPTLIVGQGIETELKVTYTDLEGAPLAGQVQFAVEGGGISFVGQDLAPTNQAGEASTSITLDEDLRVIVTASAPGAAPVQWSVQSANLPLTVEGDYSLNSNFASVAIADNGIAEAAALFRDMTDEPLDPGKWVVDRILDEVDSGIVSSAVGLARPSLDGWINDLLASGAAADYKERANEIATQLEALSAGIGSRSELRIRPGASEDSYRATHELLSMVAQVNGGEFEKTLGSLGFDPVAAADVQLTKTENAELAIDDHDLRIPYGAMALATLEEAIIPQVRPGATDVPSLLTSFINCQDIGQSIADFVGLGSADTYDGPCNLAVSTAVSNIESKLLEMDQFASASVVINGFAKLADSNADGEVDALVDGNWYGAIQMGTSEQVLVDGSSNFSAQRK